MIGAAVARREALRRIVALGAAVVVGAALASGAISNRAHAQSTPAQVSTAKAIFAGGCFWCVESDFDKIDGVISTTSGYTGGKVANPTYEMVTRENTGHAEAVEIVYDPRKVSYEELLAYFWRTVDPTVRDRQFCDVGSSYRTAIFAIDDAQLRAAQASREALERSKPFKAPIVTEIVAAGPFYRAEEYHQDYYLKNPLRYKYYRARCGRENRLQDLWGAEAGNPSIIAKMRAGSR